VAELNISFRSCFWTDWTQRNLAKCPSGPNLDCTLGQIT